MLTYVLLASLGTLTPVALASPQSGGDSLWERRREYPLNCRGGGQLVFDTLGLSPDTGGPVRLSLTFAVSPAAAGPEGQGLQPGTCAWVDRTLNREEPRRLRFTLGSGDSTPRLTVRDTAVYWSFLAHNSDSGHLTAVGYRHWHASSPPLGQASQAPARASIRQRWLPFDPRLLPLLAIGWMLIAWGPFLMLCGVWSGWRRLAGLYPTRDRGMRRAFRSAPMVMGMTNYRVGVRLTPDDTHLHFSMSALVRPGHPPFSVPWSDIEARRDAWPWFPLKGLPFVRLILARDPDLRILVPASDGQKLVAASGGRLELREPVLPPARDGAAVPG